MVENEMLELFVWAGNNTLDFLLIVGVLVWGIVTIIEAIKTPSPVVLHDNEQCPTCGYYCTGKGGVGCIDKPTMKGDT